MIPRSSSLFSYLSSFPLPSLRCVPSILLSLPHHPLVRAVLFKPAPFIYPNINPLFPPNFSPFLFLPRSYPPKLAVSTSVTKPKQRQRRAESVL